MSMTGATDEQIMAAAQRRYEDSSQFRGDLPWDRLNRHLKTTMADMLERDYAQYLVPPEHRVVSVDDLRVLLDGFELDYDERELDHRVSAIDRIRTLIGAPS